MISLLERLTSPLDLDAYASAVNPLWGTRLRGVVEAVIPQTGSAASIRIRPGATWSRHVPGQAVTIGVDVDGVRHHRTFTITSVPDADDRCIEITVESDSGGVVSSHLVQRARRGEVVQLSKPHGGFTVPSGRPGKLLFVTGGSGITPAIAIIRSILASGSSPGVVLLHHSKSPERTLFRSELAAWADGVAAVEVHSTYTSQGGGHLTSDRLDTQCPDWAEREVYACGPAPLVDFVKSHFAGADLADSVHTESFLSGLKASAPRSGCVRPAGQPLSTVDRSMSTETESKATFGRSGVQVSAASGVPLLDVAESAGLQPAHGCRQGICHSCTTFLQDGCVSDLRDGRLSEAGSHVQICVSAAVGDVSLDL